MNWINYFHFYVPINERTMKKNIIGYKKQQEQYI